MEVFDAICKRASIRLYENKQIDKSIIEKLIDAGRRAPSARAVEPWDFIIITNREVLQKISDMAPNAKFIKFASAVICIICDDTKYYLEDGCAAIENILLMAADSGLGACWIAGDKKDYDKDIISMLGAPESKKLIGLISLGWPKEDKNQQKKRSLTDVIHWEKY